jgi:hypothetical protein
VYQLADAESRWRPFFSAGAGATYLNDAAWDFCDPFGFARAGFTSSS